ncbi:MAG: choice-of-anchor L domain-containing protein, partial [Bacteroidota bacterium]
MTLFNTRIATLLFCLISISNINSQISVTPNLTAQQLAEIFAGSNLTVSNATLTGSPTAVGSFTSSGFTYNSGIVLNTGLAVNAAGPNDDPNTGDNLGQAGSDILEAIGGAASRDAVILEFDFVVQSSSVQFNYIFASEEYPEFAPPNQPDFTDVFAFFISGPGITGEENIAIIPGTSLPVTIQNVNPVTNSQFYIDNIGGSEIQYDGYTTSLGAFKDGLIACQTYHLKLMISDIRTSTRNSAVFLQENSFVQDAGTLIVDSQTILADNLAREGCTKGSFTFKIPEPEPTDRIISFTIGGSAVNGVDYQHIDNFLIIPAGDTSATLYINSISDGISEGQEDIIFDFAAGGCSGTGTATMLIDDSQPIEFTLDKNDLTCFENNTGEIIVNASGGFPPYNFTYTNDLGVSNSSSTSPITGLSSGQYSINVSDSYGCKAEALVIGGLFNAGTTFLPDGSGVSYEAPLTISGFGAGDLINNVSQVQQVCLSLEHSYMGDLSIELISPSGQVLLLKQAGGGSTDLGEPVATGPVDGDGSSDPTPGNGYEYCFNANPTFGTMVSESGNNFRTDYVDNVGNMYSDGFLPAGSYQAESSFNALIGSTLNGEWKIRVTDNAFLDNGYIFNWYISLIGELPDSIVVLDEPNEILISGQSIDASCGTANGSINTTVFNAIAPYTVLWSNSAITEDINSINAGTYTINVTDNNSCVSSKNFIVNNSSSIAITPNVSPVSCFNGNNASINITVTGGQSPYIYSWSNGAITEDLSTLSPGIYTVTVTDQAGCIKLLEVEIVNASPIVINVVDLQNEICNTDNGLISVTASGGSGSYGFSWDNNSTSQTINNLSAGTYNLTVSDNLTCTATQAITVTNDISNCSSFCFLDVEENLITNETCGNSAGSVDINVLNGIFPLQISWSNGSITEDISGLNAGDYTVEITDNNSCSVIKTFTVSNNTGNLQISQALVSDEICNNNQGTINLTVSGGNLPYSFTWSNGSNTEDISNLSSNNYTVSVRDGNNCLAQQSFLILNDAGNLAVSSSVNQSFCGGNSGSIIQTVSGANGAITHSWNDGPITQNRTNLAPGNYICTTTDALGCSVQNFYTITEISGDIVILGENATSEICNNNQGSIDLTTSGTTLSYLWSNGAITEDISGLNSGNYSCLITNGQGCQLSTGTIYVGNSNGGIIVGTQTILPEICDGSNGAINVNIIGGTSPYTFSWDNGALSEDLISVSTGDYTVNVTDLNGCVKSQSFHVGENQGTLVINNAVLTNEICGNSAGNINLNLSGGTSPYVISWSNGAITEDISSLNSANYTVTIQDANGCNLNSTYFIDNTTNGFSVSHIATSEVCSNGNGAIDLNISGGQTPYTFLWSNGALTEDLTGISTGNYSCVITDNLGCTLSSGTITIGNFSNTLSATASITHATCTNDGAINLAVSGGQAPYSYVWSNGSLIEDLGAISAGIYSCVVTDVNNCSTTKTLEVIATNNNLAFTYNFTDEICNNNLGSINLSTTGGSGSLNFIWSNGGVTEDINNLNSGNYTCTITDQSSCSITTNAIQISNQSSSLQITSLTKIDEVCNNNSASINLSISGGTDPITYSWSNGSVTQDLSGLSEGVYSVVVSDASNCSTSAQVTVLNSAGNLNANLTSLVNESCTNAQGSIQLTTSGGTSPYTYSWSNGQITEDLSNLSAGTYSVLITDNLTCTTTENFTIANNGADLAIQSVAKIDESCSNNGGSINLTVSGGSQPYAYLWSNGSNLQDLTNLSAGNYTVDITDANGCTINSSYTILNQAGNLALSATTTDESCGLSNGAINVSVSGGNLPLSYSWNTGSINQDLSAISAGNYNLVVTDNFGCNVNYNTTINNTTNGLSLSLESKSDENCGLIDGAIAVNSTGSTPITFVWSNGDISEDISGVSAGTYTLTATDNLGCSTSFTETISNQTGSLAISFSNTFSPICANNNGFIDIEVSGNGPFTYGWSNGQITQDIVSLAANTYSVTITDNNNCQLTQSFNLNSSSTPLTLSSSVTGSNCGSSTGQINVSVLSGVAPYTYNWSNGAIIEDLTNLAPGDYTVIVNDFFGCTASLNETVNSLNNSTVQLFGVFENDDFCSQNQGGIFISANNVENFYINGQQDFNFGNFFNLAAGT